MLHESEKNPKAPPSISEQEKAQFASAVPDKPGHELKSAGKEPVESKTADADLGKPGDAHPHQDGDAPKA